MQDPNVRRAQLVGVTFVLRRLLPPPSKLGPDCGSGLAVQRVGHKGENDLFLDKIQAA
jgi:hypothetical protein